MYSFIGFIQQNLMINIMLTLAFSFIILIAQHGLCDHIRIHIVLLIISLTLATIFIN